MESWGKHCHNCENLDFLPLLCYYCRLIFCKDCHWFEKHKCSKYSEEQKKSNDNNQKITEFEKFACCYKNCKIQSKVQIICPACGYQFCLKHRNVIDHECKKKEEIKAETRNINLQQDRIISEAIAKTKSKTNNANPIPIPTKRKKLKNTAMARKVAIMKLKNTAIGDNSIPENDRFHLKLIISPEILNNKSSSSKKDVEKGVFINKFATIGKNLDKICDVLKIINRNNEIQNEDERLGLSVDGENKIQAHLLTKDVLENGDSVYLL